MIREKKFLKFLKIGEKWDALHIFKKKEEEKGKMDLLLWGKLGII